MLGLIEKMFIKLLTALVNGFNHKKIRIVEQLEIYDWTYIYILMITANNFTNIHLQLKSIDVLEVVILFMTYLINYVSNKTEDLNIHAFNMMTRKNGSKLLTKFTSCNCKGKFDEKKYNSNQKSNND